MVFNLSSDLKQELKAKINEPLTFENKYWSSVVQPEW